MSRSQLIGLAALIAFAGQVQADDQAMVNPALAMAKAKASAKPILVYVYDSG